MSAPRVSGSADDRAAFSAAATSRFVVGAGSGGALAAHEQAQLLPLAGADVRRRVEVRALLRERGDDDESERLRELPQLGQGRLELDVVDVRELHGHHGGALRLFLEFLHDVRAA